MMDSAKIQVFQQREDNVVANNELDPGGLNRPFPPGIPPWSAKGNKTFIHEDGEPVIDADKITGFCEHFFAKHELA